MKNFILTGVILCMAQLGFAQNTVSGTVTDESGETLVGATVVISGTTNGATTDVNGKFNLTFSEDFPWTIEISYVGYGRQVRTASSSGDIGNISLAEDAIIGQEVVITASRSPEKAVQAVASVTAISPKTVSASPISGDPTELLRNTRGVNLIRSGTGYSNVELRGSSSVNFTNTLVLRDYAPMTTHVQKRMNSANSALNTLDVAKVEVVRGPAGALYGPNVTSGVVHFITKDAFKYTGVDVMAGIGEQGTSNFALRYAGNNGGKLGWKFLGAYSKSEDFKVDSLIMNTGAVLVVPQTFETIGGKRFENINNLNQELSSWNFEASMEYRATDKIKINYLFGMNSSVQNYRNQTAHLFNGDQRYEQQLRLTSGNLFVTAYHRHTFGNINDDGTPNGRANNVFSFNYSTDPAGGLQVGDPIGAADYFDIGAQYLIPVNDDLEVIVGGDAKMAGKVDDIRRFGEFNNQNEYNIVGGYLSAKYNLSDKLSINGAARIDNYSPYGSAFSPRLGMVYSPNENSGLRLSYSRSFNAQGQVRSFLDFTLPVPGFFPETHARAVADAVTYNNPVTRFAFGDVAGGKSFALQDVVNALAANAGVAAPTVSGNVDASLFAGAFQGPLVGSPGGAISSLEEVGSIDPKNTLSITNQIEIGYGTTIDQKWKINIDIYFIRIQNFQPQGIVPISAGAQLDVASITSSIESQVPAGTDRDALIAALNSVPPNPTPNPGFNGTPGYGLIMSDNAQNGGYAFDVGFPTYGNKDANYIGLDFGTTYYVNSDFNVFANYSYVSKNIWSPGDLGETNPNFEFFLNTPPSRLNIGLNYLPETGFYGMIAMNYQGKYEGKQGDGRIFTGLNEARTLVDTSLGYRFGVGASKFDLGLTVNNLFDEKYSHFIHLPTIRRVAMFRLKAHF